MHGRSIPTLHSIPNSCVHIFIYMHACLHAYIPRSIPLELSSRFDALFGLTFALQKLDYWMYDNEYGGIFINKIIKMLGHAWMKILQKTDAQLGIDAEYTRPAIECLLTQMEEYFGDCEYATLPFTWQ